MLKLCTIDLAFNRGCFEAILIENTCRTLGVRGEATHATPLRYGGAFQWKIISMEGHTWRCLLNN
jgi:hypothetical protein